MDDLKLEQLKSEFQTQIYGLESNINSTKQSIHNIGSIMQEYTDTAISNDLYSTRASILESLQANTKLYSVLLSKLYKDKYLVYVGKDSYKKYIGLFREINLADIRHDYDPGLFDQATILVYEIVSDIGASYIYVSNKSDLDFVEFDDKDSAMLYAEIPE